MAYFDKHQVLQKMLNYPVIPVFYHSDAALTLQILKSCYQGGLRVFEFTNRGEHAESVFREAYKFVRSHCAEMALGIGTVFTAEQAELFIEIGADFIVQPVTSPEVADVCFHHHVAWVPGAATPTEIYNASRLGAELIKIFPANVLGTGFVKALKGPLPHVRLMATGGVEPNPESISSWLQAGVSCVGLGSQLFPPALIAGRDFEAITKQVKELMLQLPGTGPVQLL